MGNEGHRIGGCEILDKLGTGSVGSVYRARQLGMDRLVALKILNPRHAQDPQYVQRFIAEARTAGRVNHPNVCQVYAAGEDKGLYYFSMEFVDGQSLAGTPTSGGRMPVPEALALARQVALALQAAHACGLVHRDVKPANILIAGSGDAKLVDLGLAKDTAVTGSEDPGLAGTPYYMAPEQAQSLDVDIRSDIYSLGATLYHMLVGRPPFTGPHATAVMIKHASEPLAPPAEVDPGIPKRVSALVEKMMAKAPDERQRDPDELVGEIDAAMSAKPAPAAPAAWGGRGGRARGRSTTGPRRPIRARGSKGKGGALVPAAVGGGAIVVAGLLIELFAFSGPGKAVKRGDEELRRAELLIQDGTITSLGEALAIARRVPRTLPATGEAEPIRDAAERIEQIAENKIIMAEERYLDGIPQAVAGGRMTREEAEAAVAQVEQRYSARATSARFQECISRLCTRTRSRVARTASEGPVIASGRGPHMGLLEGGPGVIDTMNDPAPPRGRQPRETPIDIPPDSAVGIILPEIEKHLEAGEFADAYGMIDVMADTVDAKERLVVESLRTRIRREADRAFARLLESVRRQVKKRRFTAAEAELTKAKANFGFAPYAEKIDAELGAVRRKEGARPPKRRRQPPAGGRGGAP